MNKENTEIPATDAGNAAPEVSKKKGKGKGIAITAVTWLARLLVGGVFTYSGFVKAVDPWGTLYKFEEYVQALGLPILPTLLVVGVFALCAFEFCIGVFTLLGCYRRSTPIADALTMLVMLPLTLWIAISNPVADCGCFGDALILTNWQTFWKNVVISLVVVWLLKYNRRCPTVISPAFQWIAVVINLLFILTISLYGFSVQPLIDFRPYKVGSPIVEGHFPAEDAAMADEDGENLVFIYEKDGVRKEFGVDDELPDEEDGWAFVERRERADGKAKGEGASEASDEATLRLWSSEGADAGNVDVTDEAILHDGRQLLLLIPDLAEVSASTTWRINSLYTWARRHGIDMIAVVSGTDSELANWKDLSMPEYPIYMADDTAIKEVARGNPAVVYTENGIIKWKSTLSSIDVDDFNAPGTPGDPMKFANDYGKTLRDSAAVYLCGILILIIVSMIPRGYSLMKRFNRGGKVRREG